MVHAALVNREVTGDQAYVPPPAEGVAVIVATAPEHIVPSLFAVPDVSETDSETVGGVVTVTVAEEGAPAQPLFEYVTV